MTVNHEMLPEAGIGRWEKQLQLGTPWLVVWIIPGAGRERPVPFTAELCEWVEAKLHTCRLM